MVDFCRSCHIRIIIQYACINHFTEWELCNSYCLMHKRDHWCHYNVMKPLCHISVIFHQKVLYVYMCAHYRGLPGIHEKQCIERLQGTVLPGFLQVSSCFNFA